MPRGSSRYSGGSDEGLPWQVIYSSFLGVLLSACMLYGGYYLTSGGMGSGATAAGVVLIIVALALAAAYVAVMMAQKWALLSCRIASPAFVAAFLAGLVWGLVVVIRSLDWSLSGTSIWRGFIDVVADVRVLLPLAGLGVSAAVVSFLFARATGRFVER